MILLQIPLDSLKMPLILVKKNIHNEENFIPRSKNPAEITKSSDPKPHRRAARQANPGETNPGIYLT